MKILLITDNHSTHGGGAEKYFFTLKSELQKQPNIVVHSLGFGPTASQGPDYTILAETTSTPMRLFWRLFFNSAKYHEIRNTIKRINPDVIHLHNIKKYTISLLNAVQGYPVIQTVHDFSPICPTGWNLHRDLTPCPTGLRFGCIWQHKRNMHSIIYTGLLIAFFRMNHLLKKVCKQFIAPSLLLTNYLKINSFQNPTYLSPFREQNNAINFDKIQPKHFLYVGQLGKHKGVDKLIDEFAIACKNDPALILKIAGKGPLENTLQQQIKNLNLEKNIFFTGWTDPTTLYEECAAVIFPSMGLEAFGLVLTEAMNHGRAIIGSNRGPTTSLVDDQQTGLLYDPLKQSDLAEKILLLANNAPLGKKMGQAGFEKLKTLMTNDKITNQMVEIYRTLL